MRVNYKEMSRVSCVRIQLDERMLKADMPHPEIGKLGIAVAALCVYDSPPWSVVLKRI